MMFGFKIICYRNKMCVHQNLPVPVMTSNLFYDATAFIIWSLAVIHPLLWLASLMKKNCNMYVNVYSPIPWLPQYLWSGISTISIAVIKIISYSFLSHKNNRTHFLKKHFTSQPLLLISPTHFLKYVDWNSSSISSRPFIHRSQNFLSVIVLVLSSCLS